MIRSFPRTLSFLRLQARNYTNNASPMRYGFVGLGQMGYPMAMNLLRKTAAQRDGAAGGTFMIYDVNPMSLSRFMNEAEGIPGANVSVALHPRDLAEKSVRSPF